MSNANVDSDFVPLGITEEPVHKIERPGARSGYRIYRASDEFEVAIPIAVIERCMLFGRKADPDEWYGLVVAKLCEDNQGRHLVVLGVVPDSEADASPGTVQTSIGSEFRTRMSARTLYPDGIIVGWAHGHLRCGAYFSSTDLATQKSWTEPHSFSIVVDPWADKSLATYRGPDSEPMELVDELEDRGHDVTSDRTQERRAFARSLWLRVKETASRMRALIIQKQGSLFALAIVLGFGYLGCQIAIVQDRQYASRMHTGENVPCVGASVDAVVPQEAEAPTPELIACSEIDGGMADAMAPIADAPALDGSLKLICTASDAGPSQ